MKFNHSCRLTWKTAGLLGVVLLTGCVQKFSHVNDTIKEAVYGFDDITMTADDINKLPYASSYMRFNDGARVFMVLAFAEKNPATGSTQLKWVSSDNAMVVTESGRVIKTLKLPTDNLARRSNFANQPLTNSDSQTHNGWIEGKVQHATYDWPQGNHYGYQADITLIKQDKQKLDSAIWSKNTTQWQEQIYLPQLDQSFTNQYWITDNGNVVKSIQYVGPDMTRIEIDILKPFAE